MTAEDRIKEAFGIDFLEWYVKIFCGDREEDKARIAELAAAEKPYSYRELLAFFEPFTKNILTKEDYMNIRKWVYASGMMIDAKIRTNWNQSELDTWEKIKQMESLLNG